MFCSQIGLGLSSIYPIIIGSQMSSQVFAPLVLDVVWSSQVFSLGPSLSSKGKGQSRVWTQGYNRLFWGPFRTIAYPKQEVKANLEKVYILIFFFYCEGFPNCHIYRTVKLKRILKGYDCFKSYSKFLQIGQILPSDWVPLRRVCYQRGYPV